jgi:Spy/CpxP family protein refolding chaperone
MRKTLVSGFMVLGVAIVCGAGKLPALPKGAQKSQPQQEEPQANTPQGRRGLDDERLKLSADQKKQIQEIRENAKSQAQSVRNDTSLTPEQKREKIRQIHRDAGRQIDAVLTPEQRKIWHEERPEHRKARRARKPQA